MSVGYGSPNLSLRKFLWQDLNGNLLTQEAPWIVLDDFNAVARMEETSNTKKLDRQRSAASTEWIFENELVDMGFTGPMFTRTRGNSSSTFEGARLDRALCNTEWQLKFPRTLVFNFPKLHSDHSPVLVRIEIFSVSRSSCSKPGG